MCVKNFCLLLYELPPWIPWQKDMIQSRGLCTWSTEQRIYTTFVYQQILPAHKDFTIDFVYSSFFERGNRLKLLGFDVLKLKILAIHHDFAGTTRHRPYIRHILSIATRRLSTPGETSLPAANESNAHLQRVIMSCIWTPSVVLYICCWCKLRSRWSRKFIYF